ncbi:MAG: hypothetical protein GY799_21300 [Desulfobulbaceae bacterium]|nr:hypothetical protein [Desulfobulbaceae bacterium]
MGNTFEYEVVVKKALEIPDFDPDPDLREALCEAANCGAISCDDCLFGQGNLKHLTAWIKR